MKFLKIILCCFSLSIFFIGNLSAQSTEIKKSVYLKELKVSSLQKWVIVPEERRNDNLRVHIGSETSQQIDTFNKQLISTFRNVENIFADLEEFVRILINDFKLHNKIDITKMN